MQAGFEHMVKLLLVLCKWSDLAATLREVHLCCICVEIGAAGSTGEPLRIIFLSNLW